ncbi:DUF2293 domain-containing protein [Agrobacterium salinitolerans]|nr:DUF2293 domain-containing protein [Agrobacterium salinitolerans]
MTRFSAHAVEKHIRKKHPGCPDFAVAFFVGEIVGRDWHGASLGKVVGITMQTSLRHLMTDYDQMLLEGVDRLEARRRVQPRINLILGRWRVKTSGI